MGLAGTLTLGLIAGGTIVLGLPIGRLRNPAPTLRAVLNALAIGILLFLIWDVMSHAWEPVDTALGDYHDHGSSLGPAYGYGALFALGLIVGLGALVVYDQWMARRMATPDAGVTTGMAAWSPARRLAWMIAVGIGLHNFAEGLAIGQSAARNEVALATLLVVGFGLHNATEGFGIVAPLAAEAAVAEQTGGADHRPSWGLLLTLGLVGGGPTFLGTIVGHRFVSEPTSVLFLMLAAGSILYVVIQLLGVAAKARRPDLLAFGLILGLLIGFATDAIVTAAGA